MIINKKGLSTVVTTLIIILLVLVAIGIVWVVVRGLIGTTETQIDIQQKCIGIDVVMESASCTSDGAAQPVYTCTAKVRKTGGIDPIGIRVFFSNDAGSIAGASGDTTLPISLSNLASGISAGTILPTKVEAIPYFGTSAAPSYCPQSAKVDKIPYP